jgi:hypothetical protein
MLQRPNHRILSFPSALFDENVLPVLLRLKSVKDCLELAEWCSSQYAFDDEDRLNSLHQAHLYAIKVSGKVKSRIQCSNFFLSATTAYYQPSLVAATAPSMAATAAP